MGRKSKNSFDQPNAPELQQVLLESSAWRQPPQNPYYPGLGSEQTAIPPPPYSDLSKSVAARNTPAASTIVMAHRPGTAVSYPRDNPSNVFVHQPSVVHYDRNSERRHRKVRSFNNEIALAALIAIALALWSRSLYDQRPCVDTLVHRPSKDISITVFNVRDMHTSVVFLSLFVFIVAIAKCSSGESKSYSCYLLIMNVATFIATCYTGYLAYLAFYSPCTLKPGEVVANIAKTFIGTLVDSLPSPDKRVFGESNVIELAKEDNAGLLIFVLDFFNFALYFGSFITGVALC